MRDEWFFDEDYIDDDDWHYEEDDDKRTWGNELIPDCKRLPFDEDDDGEPEPDEGISSVEEYVEKFREVINACGQTSYYFHMKKNLAAEMKTPTEIATKYGRNSQYYKKELEGWKNTAEKAFDALDEQAAHFGYLLLEKNLFLNMLTLWKDRRDAYKGYLDTCLKNGKALSPIELERKYQKGKQKKRKKK